MTNDVLFDIPKPAATNVHVFALKPSVDCTSYSYTSVSALLIISS